MVEELVCYCFNYTAADIIEDVKTHGCSTIMERIVAEKKDGRCRCAETNSKGR